MARTPITWHPIYIEPIEGSGERLTIAIAGGTADVVRFKVIGEFRETFGPDIEAALAAKRPMLDALAGALEELRPVIAQAAQRIHDRPERVAARRWEAELATLRTRLVMARMVAFRQEQRRGSPFVSPGMERDWAEQARAEEGRQRQAVGAMGEAALRQALRREGVLQRWLERRQRRAAAWYKGPGPGW